MSILCKTGNTGVSRNHTQLVVISVINLVVLMRQDQGETGTDGISFAQRCLADPHSGNTGNRIVDAWDKDAWRNT